MIMKATTYLTFFGLTLAFFISTPILGAPGSSSPQVGTTDPADQLPPGEGKGYVQTICTSCHGLGLIVGQQKTKVGWEATVYDMLGRISAGMDREAEIISGYLAAHFGVTPAPSVVDNAVDSTALPTADITIYHQVVFRFKPAVSVDQIEHILDAGRKMLQNISEVASVVVGEVAQKDSKYTHGLVTGFRSDEDLQSYRSNPDHRAWLTDIFRPVIEESLVTDIISSQ